MTRGGDSVWRLIRPLQSRKWGARLTRSRAPMRVCFFIGSLGDGGAQRQCIALLNSLQHTEGLDMHVMLLRSGEHDDSLDVSRLSVHRTNISNFANPLALWFALRTILRIRPDVLVSWLLPADIWSYAATRIVRGVPWIMTERNSFYPDALDANLRRRFGRAASVIIANSEQGKMLWDDLAPRVDILCIPNIMSRSAVPMADGESISRASSCDCLFIGRLESQKNVLMMVSAFGQFGSMNPDGRLMVVGQGSLRDEMSAAVRSVKLPERVEFLGFRKDIPELMGSARLLISLSLHEGMPNVLMEAVAANLPAVVSDIPEHRALLGDDYPYYVPLHASPADAAEVISRAWDDAANVNGCLYSYAIGVLSTMAPEKVLPAYIEVFDRVASLKPQSGALR